MVVVIVLMMVSWYSGFIVVLILDCSCDLVSSSVISIIVNVL